MNVSNSCTIMVASYPHIYLTDTKLVTWPRSVSGHIVTNRSANQKG